MFENKLSEKQKVEFDENLNRLENVQAVAINHDGITGTMTRVVEQDLFKMMQLEIDSVQENLFELIHAKNEKLGFNTSNY